MPPLLLLAVFVENKPSQTARVTRLLADANIDIRWVTIASQGTFGVMKFLVSEPERAQQVLRQNGHMTSFLGVVPVVVEDRPGALCSVAECLAEERINLDNTSGFVANGRAVIVIETHQIDQALTALERAGFQILTSAEMMGTQQKGGDSSTRPTGHTR